MTDITPGANEDKLLTSISQKALATMQRIERQRDKSYLWNTQINISYFYHLAHEEIVPLKDQLSMLLFPPEAKLINDSYWINAITRYHILPRLIQTGSIRDLTSPKSPSGFYLFIRKGESKETFIQRADAMKQELATISSSLEAAAHSFLDYVHSRKLNDYDLDSKNATYKHFLEAANIDKFAITQLDEFLERNKLMIHKVDIDKEIQSIYYKNPHESLEKFKKRALREWKAYLPDARKSVLRSRKLEDYRNELRRLILIKESVTVPDIVSLIVNSHYPLNIRFEREFMDHLEKDLESLFENKSFGPQDVISTLKKEGHLQVRVAPVTKDKYFILKRANESQLDFDKRVEQEWIHIKKFSLEGFVNNSISQKKLRGSRAKLATKKLKKELKPLWDNDSAIEL